MDGPEFVSFTVTNLLTKFDYQSIIYEACIVTLG